MGLVFSPPASPLPLRCFDVVEVVVVVVVVVVVLIQFRSSCIVDVKREKKV